MMTASASLNDEPNGRVSKRHPASRARASFIFRYDRVAGVSLPTMATIFGGRGRRAARIFVRASMLFANARPSMIMR
jgi:hypothetical protein